MFCPAVGHGGHDGLDGLDVLAYEQQRHDPWRMKMNSVAAALAHGSCERTTTLSRENDASDCYGDDWLGYYGEMSTQDGVR